MPPYSKTPFEGVMLLPVWTSGQISVRTLLGKKYKKNTVEYREIDLIQKTKKFYPNSYVTLEKFIVAFNDNPGQWLTRSCSVVIPIIRGELSTVCKLCCLEMRNPAADGGTHGGHARVTCAADGKCTSSESEVSHSLD